jgi:uncharacterized protein YjeT (DUF2065 family)
MVVTLEGITSLVRPEQRQKVRPSMAVTLEGIMSSVRPGQAKKAKASSFLRRAAER